MKKIIGILGVAFIVATMFFSTNNLKSSGSDVSLDGLLAMNTANAEVKPNGLVEDILSCKYTITVGCCGFTYSTEVDGRKTDCVSGAGECWTTGLCF